MDVVIILLIIGIIVFFVKRTFSGFVYSIGMLDILLRIIAFLNSNLFNRLSGEVYSFFATYFPTSFPNMIYKYTNGSLAEVLIWIYVIIILSKYS